MTPSPQLISGVVLAGGRSSRMGFDKAQLQLDGQSLVQRQIELLRQAGAGEVLVSLPAGASTVTSFPGIRVITDSRPDAGPVSGIERALAEARHDRVLVVAVDMPALTVSLLAPLVAASGEGRGVLPTIGERVEPLVAIYPKAARPLALRELSHGRGAARDFAQACLEAGLVDRLALAPGKRAMFANWNTPDELPPSVRATLPRGDVRGEH